MPAPTARRRHADPDGRRPDQAARRSAARRRDRTAPSARRRTAATSRPRCSPTGRPSSRRTGSPSRTAPSSSPAAITASSPDRGWKHVTGARAGRGRRPHLTIDNSSWAPGEFAGQPEHADDYRRGYLCGMIRGDGHLGTLHLRAAGRPLRRCTSVPPRPGRREAPRPDAGAILRREASRRRASRSPRRPALGGCDAIRTSARERTSSASASSIAWPRRPTRRLAQGIPRRDLRCRGLRRPGGAADLRTRDPSDLSTGRTCAASSASASTSSSRTRHARTAVRTCASAAASASGCASSTPSTRRSPASARSTGSRRQVGRATRGRVDRAARRGDAALRHHDRHRRLHRQRRRQPQLLRPPDPRVPRA